MVDWATIDYENPCTLLAALRPIYYRLLAGEKVVELQHEGLRTRFDSSVTALSELKAKIASLEIECAAAGGTRKRSAIITG